MKTLSKEYSTLFNLISDVSNELNKLNNDLYTVSRRLKDAQRITEEMFIADEGIEGSFIQDEVED